MVINMAPCVELCRFSGKTTEDIGSDENLQTSEEFKYIVQRIAIAGYKSDLGKVMDKWFSKPDSRLLSGCYFGNAHTVEQSFEYLVIPIYNLNSEKRYLLLSVPRKRSEILSCILTFDTRIQKEDEIREKIVGTILNGETTNGKRSVGLQQTPVYVQKEYAEILCSEDTKHAIVEESENPLYI